MVVITLKETLSERGITQSELSKLAGLRPSTVSSLLNGSTRIEFETIEKIAKALNTDDIREIISLKQEIGREKDLLTTLIFLTFGRMTHLKVNLKNFLSRKPLKLKNANS